jgi:hypothetical protein
MKIAAGCFGCLAFMFLGLALVLSFGGAFITTMLNGSGLESSFAEFNGYIAQGSGSCCCLSAGLAIVFLVVGSMGKKQEEIE